jgi:hypothetical protein
LLHHLLLSPQSEGGVVCILEDCLLFSRTRELNPLNATLLNFALNALVEHFLCNKKQVWSQGAALSYPLANWEIFCATTINTYPGSGSYEE